MKVFDKLILLFVLLAVLMFAAVNFLLLSANTDADGLYKVEINRVEGEISRTAPFPT